MRLDVVAWPAPASVAVCITALARLALLSHYHLCLLLLRAVLCCGCRPHSCGYAGCTLIRLTIGLHHYPDIESIRDDGRRAAVERACLQLGRQLLLVSQQHPGPPGDVQQQLSIGRVQQLVAQACGGWL